MKRINFPGNKDLIGKIVKVTITEAGHWILWGKVL